MPLNLGLPIAPPKWWYGPPVAVNIKKYDVAGIGNALLDYQVEVPFSFLEKHHLKRGSMTLVDANFQHKILDESVQTFGLSSIRTTSGGCAANTLAGVVSYGGSGIFMGKVAKDDQGEAYMNDLRHCGLDTSIVPEVGNRTGTCVALITPDAERTMLTNLAISTEIKETDILAEKIEASEIVYVEGYLWDPPLGRAASLRAMEIAKQKGRKVSFTFSDSFCVERHHQDFVELAKTKIDILFCNEHEAIKATGARTIIEAFQIMRAWAPIVCCTTGPKGALLSDRAKNIVEHVPTWHVRLVDKLGAGDLFAAGVLYGLTHDYSLRDAGHLGCYSATRIIQQMSARLEESLAPYIETALQGPTNEEAQLAAAVV